MGFFSSVWGGIKAVASSLIGSGGSSSSGETHSSSSVSNRQTIYEPDKLKVAELENGRMERAIEAQKEIIQMNNEMQLMIMEAHQKGFEQSTKLLKEMMVSLNQIAQERLILIENGHFEVVEKIEKLYLGLEKEIREDNNDFNISQLPQMLEILSKFEVGSSSEKLYQKSVDKQIELNGTFFTQKLTALHERQKMMVESSIKSKEQVLEQSAQIVSDRMKFLDKQLENQQDMKLISNETQQINLKSSNSDDVEVKLIEDK